MNEAPAGPRIWPSLVVFLGIVPAVIVVNGIFALTVIAIDSLLGGAEDAADSDRFTELMAHPWVFAGFLVTAQAMYALAAWVPASLSPVPRRERLGLVPGRLRRAFYPLVMLATLFAWQVGAILWSLLFDELSPQLQQMSRLYTDSPLPVALLLVALSSILPGFCEELLCRGYVQRRLLQRWPPALAVLFTSLGFALMHLDPQHVVSVIPAAIWLGYVAWRTDSTWPSIACHFFMNATALGLSVLLPAEDPSAMNWTLTLALLGVSAPAFVGALLVFHRRPGLRSGSGSEV